MGSSLGPSLGTPTGEPLGHSLGTCCEKPQGHPWVSKPVTDLGVPQLDSLEEAQGGPPGGSSLGDHPLGPITGISLCGSPGGLP